MRHYTNLARAIETGMVNIGAQKQRGSAPRSVVERLDPGTLKQLGEQ